MHIHILGICGTFMGGVALLARAAGHTVTGCDANVYPPMSTQLEEQGIGLIEGYDTSQLDLEPDMYVVGNAVSRGNPLLEFLQIDHATIQLEPAEYPDCCLLRPENQRQGDHGCDSGDC